MSVVSIESVTNSIEEFRNFIEYRVVLDAASNTPVTVNFRTLYDGTATNLDLKNTLTSTVNNGTADPNNGSITFAPGQTVQTILVEADRDTLDEPDEHVVLELFDPTNGTFDGGVPVLRAAGVILDDDGAANNATYFVGDPVIVEGDSGAKVARFEVVLSRPQSEATTLSYATFDGSARAGQDYNGTSGSIVLAAGDTRATIDVSVIGDSVPENTEWFGLRVTDSAGRFATTADSAGYAEIRDTDASPQPEISIRGDATIEEFANFIRFTVSLSEPSNQAVTVNYRTLYDHSASDQDLSSVLTSPNNNGVVTFEAGQTEQTILIEAIGDPVDEADEAFTVELFGPDNAVFGTGQPVLRAMGIVLDDDGGSSNVALFVSDPVLVENDQGQQIAVFDIELSRPAPQRLTFDYATRDGSALAGEDYLARSGTLAFEEGETRASVTVPVLGDRVAEAAEWFALAITSPSVSGVVDLAGAVGYAEIRDTDDSDLPEISIQGSATIEEIDSFVRFTVSLSQTASETVSVNYRALFDGTVTNADLGNTLTSTSNNGTSGANNGVLTFEPGEITKSILIEADRDSLEEADEAFTLELFDPTNATFGAGQPSLRANGVILDDDGTGSDLALFVGDPVLLEGNSGRQIARFDIELSRPASAALTLNYTTKDGTARAGSDYVAQSGQVVFEEGQTRASVQVEVIGDTVAEANEWFALRLTPGSGPAVNRDDSVGYAEIRDSETSALPEISIQGDSTIEDFGNFMRFTVALSEASTEAVSVDYSVGFATASRSDLFGALPGGTLTFAPGETMKDVVVEPTGDGIAEFDESLNVTLSNPVRGVFGMGVSEVAAGGFIFGDDSEAVPRALYGAPLTVTEAPTQGDRVGITLELSDPSAQALSFAIERAGGTATGGQDYRLLTTQVTFQPFETRAAFYVEILEDGTGEDTEFVDFSVRALNTGLFSGEIPDVRLTIEDGTVVPDIVGSPVNDTRFGTAAPEILRGLDGNDTLTGGGGDDTVNGGAGEDTAVYLGRQESYTLTFSQNNPTLLNRADPFEGT
ncbi:MAG: Calx-beta domain-containing protein, partial [Pseudomonadota bacterium]